jgi:hypothetical protein
MTGAIRALNDVKYPTIAKSSGSMFKATNGFINRLSSIGMSDALK